VFHVSNLRQYIPDPDHVIQYKPLQLKENLTYVVEPVRILERKERTLRNKTIPFMKVLSKHHKSANATWEPEHIIREKYPELFSTGM